MFSKHFLVCIVFYCFSMSIDYEAIIVIVSVLYLSVTIFSTFYKITAFPYVVIVRFPQSILFERPIQAWLHRNPLPTLY